MTFDWENKADPLQNGFGVLKILNEEVISPGRGFILHTHRDMVIVTYVQEGVVIYNSPLEKAALLESGHFHLIDAAPQSKQFAFDASPLDDAHVFQSGFVPGTGVSNPEGEKKFFTLAERRGILRLIASPRRERSLAEDPAGRPNVFHAPAQGEPYGPRTPSRSEGLAPCRQGPYRAGGNSTSSGRWGGLYGGIIRFFHGDGAF